MTNVVVTTLLTSSPDPQRGVKWEPDPAVLAPLITSVKGAEVVVLHDEPLHWDQRSAVLDTARFVQVPPGGNPYHARWRHIDHWLAERHAVDHVFAVDGTDVEMLHEPWDDLVPFAIHVGSEQPDDAARVWLRETHPSFGGLVPAGIANAGICGGGRAAFDRFLRVIVPDLDGPAAGDLTDMAAFDRSVATFPTASVITEDPVHTRLHGYEDDHPTAWWRHK